MQADGTDGSWRDFLPLSAVIACGFLLSINAFLAVRSHYQTIDRQQFQRSATYYSTRFKDEVARHVTSLAAIRAFVSASRGVSRWEFSAFAHQILPQNPGFKAMLWVPAVTGAERGAYETGLQQDGLYGLRIHELTDEDQVVDAGEHQSYLPISYVEPFDGNETLVGLDLAQMPRFARMFQAADQSGRVAASTPVHHSLVSGVRGPSLVLAFPLNTGAKGASQGYALGVLQLQTVIQEALGPSAPIQLAITYREDGKGVPQLLSDQAGSAADWLAATPSHQSAPFDIAGQHFELAMRAPDHADPATSLYVPAGASLLVLALTGMLAQNMAATVLRKRLVERAVVSRTAQLRAANEALRGEVEQRRQAESDLRIARDKAESASRAKSAFMATMSHELRTPLNAIIGFSSILADAKGNQNPRHDDYAGEILGSGKRLLDLINDILDLTQMDPAAMDDGALVYLTDCVHAVVAQAQPAAQSAGVTLKVSVSEEMPALHGDSKRIGKAIAHLVSNAIKFTPEGGAAVILAKPGPDDTQLLEVVDTGVGMPREAQAKIRERFSQYDGRLGRRYDGVGLGLTYVGRVAELHDATLDIVSEAGKGTCVRLVFRRNRIARTLEVA